MRPFTLQISGLDAAGATVTTLVSNLAHLSPTDLQFIDGRLKVSGILQRNMYGGNKARGPMSLNMIAFTLENSDGALDGLRDYAYDKQLAYLYELDPTTYVRAAQPLAAFVLEQPICGMKEIVFSARDIRYTYDQPLLELRYAGTNAGSPMTGIEGTANDIKGQLKPLVLGRVQNWTPVCVNTDLMIYQVTGVAPPYGGPASSGGLSKGLGKEYILIVKDMGVPLTALSEYTSEAQMYSVAPLPGTYKVLPSAGCFRLASAPVGQITCDVTNYVNNLGSGPAGSIRLRDVLAAVGRVNSAWMPGGTLNGGPECGVVFDQDISRFEAMQVLGAGYGIFDIYGRRPDAGTDVLESWQSRLDLPTVPGFASQPSLKVDASNIIDGLLQQEVPEDDGRGMPVWQVSLKYGKNYTVMGETDIAGSVSEVTAQSLGRDWLSTFAQDASVKTQWPAAGVIQMETAFTAGAVADVQAEADRLLALFKVRREMYSFRISGVDVRAQMNQHYFQPGSKVKLTYARYGLNAGKDMIAIGIQENLDADMLTVTVWG